MELITHEFELPLQHTFTISRESTNIQPTLIVELSDGKHQGYGEATTNTYYGMSLAKMKEGLERVRPTLERTETLDPPALWHEVAPQLQDCPFALCALDQAAYDLWGKQQGKPVHQLWGLDIKNAPLSNYTIGIDNIDVMLAKLEEMPGWPIYKIKLGTAHDLEIVRELRKATDAVFRVDANCGWNADEAIRNSHELKSLNVEFIEQPLPADDWGGYRKVFKESALPIVADESCITEADVSRCHNHFHGINIKLVKCGGLTPARRMIDEARNLGMKVMVGCMTESSVGISAIAQLLPLLDYVDMDGAVLLAQDIATGVVVDKGKCNYPDVDGNGVQLLQVS
ncbi:dipeptide epimerase [Bythopirellula polymerisocia]|uniref:Dipeptide epimerase n=1 Tax=Bythopirellula polymerisocia TaxID=2528003 RepID=A0A5C6CI77_9BACT|nr:dipeptide epimerase [Bythopirellula polymerisocia]TWU24513.1 L-Ala-D/L-Glu epimerase [Bythopirellula polymerisocia]